MRVYVWSNAIEIQIVTRGAFLMNENQNFRREFKKLNASFMWSVSGDLVSDYKNPLYFDVVDRYLWRMKDKTIPDEAPLGLSQILCRVCLHAQKYRIKLGNK